MSRQLTAEDARQSLTDHVASKGQEIREKYGPWIGWHELQRILEDRSCVRYPCEIVFNEGPLQPGEFAFPAPKGKTPDEGFALYVHPFFATQPEKVPYLVLYQLVQVNYGDFATANEAETFGAAALGLGKDEYYRAVCALADQLAGTEAGHACPAASGVSVPEVA